MSIQRRCSWRRSPSNPPLLIRDNGAIRAWPYWVHSVCLCCSWQRSKHFRELPPYTAAVSPQMSEALPGLQLQWATCYGTCVLLLCQLCVRIFPHCWPVPGIWTQAISYLPSTLKSKCTFIDLGLVCLPWLQTMSVILNQLIFVANFKSIKLLPVSVTYFNSIFWSCKHTCSDFEACLHV